MDNIELVASLNERELFLPAHHVRESVYFILCFLVACSILYSAALQAFSQMEILKGKSATQIKRISFEFVAVVKNVGLVTAGLYYFFCCLPKIEETTITERITGYEDVVAVARIQLAFNIFSIPLSMFVLGETGDMIVHHCSVLMVGFLSTFFTCGFRYHAPYFYGVIEITSIAYATMKVFKEIPEWIMKYSGYYSLLRLFFGGPFILVRIIFWMPQIADVIKLTWLVYQTCESTVLRVLVGFFLLSSVALTILQVFWGGLVIKGALKQVKWFQKQKVL